MKIIVYCQQKVKNTVLLRQNELYAAKEDVFKRSMLQISDILMQGGKRMENKMFCYQCQETAGCTGCTQAGVCGKKPDVAAMQEALSGIIGTYERDFAKHPNISEFPKISMIWKSIPSQLARENKKFIYKVVKEGARAREYEDALQWLVDSRLVHKIYRSSAPGLPVAAYDDLSAFKIYLVDVGLLRRLAQLAPTAFGEGNRLFTEFKGALTEDFVLQTLITQFEVIPRYWSQNNPPYEVDFLIQRENDIFPVEVKSETNTTSKSLKKFKELFPDQVKLRVRFSLDNLKMDDDVLNIPLFMADHADRLIGLALEQKNK